MRPLAFFRFCRGFISGLVMAIAREDMEEGGFVLMKTRFPGVGGAAVAMKKHRAKVLTIMRGGVQIRREDNGKQLTVKFCDLEPDEEWLSQRDVKEAQKRKRIEQDLRLVEPPPKPPLTYSLTEKYNAIADADDEDGPVASEHDRQEALRQLEALKQKPEDVTWRDRTVNVALEYEAAEERVEALVEANTTVWPKDERTGVLSHAEGDPFIAPPTPTIPAPGGHPSKPIYNPTPWPKEMPSEIPHPGPRPRPVPAPEYVPPAPEPIPAQEVAPLSPLQRLLQRVQAEFEQLIAEEAELDELEPELTKSEASLSEALEACRGKLQVTRERREANKARQAVLSAQEKQLMKSAPKVAPPAAPPPEPASVAPKTTHMVEFGESDPMAVRNVWRSSSQRWGSMNPGSVDIKPFKKLIQAIGEQLHARGVGRWKTRVANFLALHPSIVSQILCGSYPTLGLKLSERITKENPWITEEYLAGHDARMPVIEGLQAYWAWSEENP